MRLRPFSSFGDRVRIRASSVYNEWMKGLQPRRAKWNRAYTAPGSGKVEHAVPVVATIHPYAGLGHQLSGMIAAELWARDLGLELVPTQMPGDPDGVFFRPSTEVGARASRALRITQDERVASSLALLSSQVERKRLKGTPLAFALDQPRWDQTPAAEWLRGHFLAGPLGHRLLRAEAAADYVAVHIRRSWFEGDISEATHSNRWVSNAWYAQLICELRGVTALRDRVFRIYSLGDPASFLDLAGLPGVEMRLNGDRDEDFVDLAAAPVLVAAPSSFSFSAALISKGTALARYPWWHNVPDRGRWVRVASDFEGLQEATARSLDYVSTQHG